MNFGYPTSFFMSSGLGMSQYPLVAFDAALLDAQIANFNLLKISSILPSKATQVNRINVKEGSPLLTAYAKIDSNIAGTQIATAVGVAIPANADDVGVIMEYSGYCSKSEAVETVSAMCKEAMRNHEIEYKEVLTTAVDAIVPEGGAYTSLVSALATW